MVNRKTPAKTAAQRRAEAEPPLPLAFAEPPAKDLPDPEPAPAPMPWWQSRTIWVQLVAMVFAIGATFDWWPHEVSQEQTVGAIMLVVALITIWTRSKASAPLSLSRK